MVDADAPDVLAYASDPAVCRYLSWRAHQTLDDSLAFIHQLQDGYGSGSSCV